MSSTTRRVYSTDELYRLRSSQSQPRLREAIEEHDGEDAEILKGHVLRGSKSFTARSFRSRNLFAQSTLHVPPATFNNENAMSMLDNDLRLTAAKPIRSDGILGEIAPNEQTIRPMPFRLRPSPTPSLKKKKAEALVKHHGSPQHVRVTAGGRIVPSEQSPLTYPRYGYSAVKTNGGVIKFAPNLHGGHEFRDHATQENFLAQDENGNFCQIIDGIVKPLRVVNGRYLLERVPPNLVDQSTQRDLTWSLERSMPRGGDPQSTDTDGAMVIEPTIAAQIAALEHEYRRLESESKDIDKAEALYGKTMPKTALATLVNSRRRLVTEKDKLRVSIKFLQNLRCQPTLLAPKSPRAVLSKNAARTPFPRAPNLFPTHQNNGTSLHAPYGPFYGGPQHQFPMGVSPYVGPTHDDLMGQPQPWVAPPPGAFMQPPGFDGSTASAYVNYAQSMHPEPGHDRASGLPRAESQDLVAQSDGTRSQLGRRDQSPKASHAVAIKIPENKPSTNVRSNLNPMSPVYKPSGVPQVETSLKPASQFDAEFAAHRGLSLALRRNALDAGGRAEQVPEDASSPSKRISQPHSSSTSSIETADFFPRNTGEYSTRQLAFPMRLESSDEKGDVPVGNTGKQHDDSPSIQPGQESHDSSWNPHLPDEIFARHDSHRDISPAILDASAVEGTLPEALAVHSIETHTECPEAATNDLAIQRERHEHNVSPKAKRQFPFVEEHPENGTGTRSVPTNGDTPPATGQRVQSQRHADMIDFSRKPIEWIEGYQAGLQRVAVQSDRAEAFLDGYCSGLLKSRPDHQTATPAFALKTVTDEHSCAVDSKNPHSSAYEPLQEQTRRFHRPVLETMGQSLDTLKQAVFAPHNENAILSPALDTPCVPEHHVLDDTQKGSHGSEHNVLAEFPFPGQTSSLRDRQDSFPRRVDDEQSHKVLSHRVTGHTGSPREPPQSSDGHGLTNGRSTLRNIHGPATGNRVTSLDPVILRQWPMHSVNKAVSDRTSAGPAEHGRGSVHFHAPGNHVADSQYDGSSSQLAKRIMSDPMAGVAASRFHEGCSEPSPSPQLSPHLGSSPSGPHGSPHRKRDLPPHIKNTSPIKSTSPTKAKFEHIAEKVGIKVVSYGTSHGSAEGVDATSPGAAKRRWRDVWRSGKPKDTLE